jgi:hypothetical protein
MNQVKPPITTNATIAQRVPFESSVDEGELSNCAETGNARTLSTMADISLRPIRAPVWALKRGFRARFERTDTSCPEGSPFIRFTGCQLYLDELYNFAAFMDEKPDRAVG